MWDSEATFPGTTQFMHGMAGRYASTEVLFCNSSGVKSRLPPVLQRCGKRRSSCAGIQRQRGFATARAHLRKHGPHMTQATFRLHPVFLGLRSWVRLAFVTSVTCTPPFAPPVRFERRKVSTFPKSKSPGRALIDGSDLFFKECASIAASQDTTQWAQLENGNCRLKQGSR